MISESLIPAKEDALQPLTPYKHPLPDSAFSQDHFLVLGGRLNIDPAAFMSNPPARQKEAYELNFPTATPQPPRQRPEVDHDTDTDTDAPFAGVADRSKRARYEDHLVLPQAVQMFRSPIDVGLEKSEGPPQVFVTTSHEVRQE